MDELSWRRPTTESCRIALQSTAKVRVTVQLLATTSYNNGAGAHTKLTPTKSIDTISLVIHSLCRSERSISKHSIVKKSWSSATTRRTLVRP